MVDVLIAKRAAVPAHGRSLYAVVFALAGFAIWPALAHAACTGGLDNGLGVARTVQIDTSNGPLFGSFTRQAHEPSFLKPKEVVLTFDDGPMPWITKSILDTLDRYCTKATFFSVGRMALAYPKTVQDVLARGHTLGSHTYSHPFNMPHMKASKAHDEIERGLAAVTLAAGQPIAPLFRFTGLADSAPLLAYLQTRAMAAFSVDAVSNDSYIHDKQKLVEHTLAEIEHNKGGIVLFHDIKTTTAKALPDILAGLKARGYKIVHITTAATAQPLDAATLAVAPRLAKAPAGGAGKALLPFYGALGPERANANAAEPAALTVTEIVTETVTEIAPAARRRMDVTGSISIKASKKAHSAPAVPLAVKPAILSEPANANSPPVLVESGAQIDPGGGWVTKIKQRPNSKSVLPGH